MLRAGACLLLPSPAYLSSRLSEPSSREDKDDHILCLVDRAAQTELVRNSEPNIGPRSRGGDRLTAQCGSPCSTPPLPAPTIRCVGSPVGQKRSEVTLISGLKWRELMSPGNQRNHSLQGSMSHGIHPTREGSHFIGLVAALLLALHPCSKTQQASATLASQLLFHGHL